ncbi:MAG TPA: amidohydrolase family protein, partial [Vicinamibacterales bacterium]|nr:amidohydrolase family protein [Vicinamibacterales bacterium]
APPQAESRVRLDGAALMPGLVNAHTHLELSYLRGAVPRAARFTDWVRDLMRLRRTRDGSTPEAQQAIADAIAEARAAGTAVIGDVSNTLASVPALEQSGLAAHVFFELLRFTGADAEEVYRAAVERLTSLPPSPRVTVTLAPHAPYSVSAALFRLIRNHLGSTGRTTVHLCESEEECELVAKGVGPWRGLLQELNAWDASWTAPGVSPVEYLDSLGFLDAGTLVVHGVHARDPDLARIRARGATLVTCPRSNRHVGVGSPPVARFYDSGVPVAVGTDSLTSAPDLNLFAELAEMRRLAPGVPARRLLESATLVGARALGLEDHGVIAPGARAEVIAVTVPPDVPDVEEYLVSGIEPEQIRWPLAPHVSTR